ncbi:cellulase family glycosylhydrolase [Streptomyces afghaniensis]|uniref:cellulase family glycosylhydrolase n=1 Tax=Streptomyces afghaniensis TaxID=66865 RepID=UPI0037A5E33B
MSKRFDDDVYDMAGRPFDSMESSMPSSAGFTRRQVMTTSAALAVTALSIPTAAQAAARSTGSAASASAMDVVADMQPGWNLGNSFEAIGADETAWGNPRVTQAFFRKLKAQGFKSIRIPVTWGQHEGPAPTFTLDPAFLARLKQVVDWALADGFYVLINMHGDAWQWVPNMPTQHDAVLAQYTATWQQIAATFRDASRRLLFESINEPFFNGSSGDEQNAVLMNELNTTFHSVVRATGGGNTDRLLVMPTLGDTPDKPKIDTLLATFAALDDPNLVASVHYYSFWPFSVNLAGYTTFNAATQQDLTDTFDLLHRSFVAKGIPVVVGEYGLLGWDSGPGTVEQGETLKYLEYLGYYARYRGLTTMLWDNGSRFNRRTMQWNDPSLYAQIRSSWTGRSGTASTDQLFVPKGKTPTDATITLNLNGTRLMRIVVGTRPLIRGVDYTVSGNTLTIAAATLSRLTASQEHGTNAVLSLRFTDGIPWAVNVITYDKPVLTSARGTTASLVIPTAFNGDKLATMEAVYADGTAAGPQSWTTYKQFNVAFVPDYTAGTITLPTAFFNEVTDNTTVTLTFHFWSGAILTYTLTRSGTAVTGTSA